MKRKSSAPDWDGVRHHETISPVNAGYAFRVECVCGWQSLALSEVKAFDRYAGHLNKHGIGVGSTPESSTTKPT